MNVSRDFRRGVGHDVTITMSLGEFREHVEFLETVAYGDGCTRDYRGWLDRIDPPIADEPGGEG